MQPAVDRPHSVVRLVEVQDRTGRLRKMEASDTAGCTALWPVVDHDVRFARQLGGATLAVSLLALVTPLGPGGLGSPLALLGLATALSSSVARRRLAGVLPELAFELGDSSLKPIGCGHLRLQLLDHLHLADDESSRLLVGWSPLACHTESRAGSNANREHPGPCEHAGRAGSCKFLHDRAFRPPEPAFRRSADPFSVNFRLL